MEKGSRMTRQQISELLIKHNMPTRQAFINDLMRLMEQQRKEERHRILDGVLGIEAQKDKEYEEEL